MRIHPRAIPGGQTDAVALRRTPVGAAVDLVVHRAGVAAGPMVRGQGPPFIARNGRRITAQDAQRAGLRPAVGAGETHLAGWRAAHPGARAVAVTGCGNLGMNPGVLAVVGDDRVGVDGDVGGWMQVAPDGRARASEEAQGAEGFAISGPRLIRGGRVALSSATTFADPRHLLLFPFLEIAPRQRADFGLDRLLADAALYARAVRGDAVLLPCIEELPADDGVDAPGIAHAVAPDALRAALAVKGYVEDAQLARRGSFRLDAERGLELRFLPGIYPHHVLAVDDAGRAASIVVSGQSNRAGVTLAELAADLVADGIRDALLMDNGGDAGYFDATTDHFDLRPAEPDRAAAWPLTACFVWHR